MSKREWQPGDVAMVHIARWPAAREWSDDTSAVLVRVAEDGYMHVVDGDPAAPLCVPPRLIAEYVRPLAVIDPENLGDVGRLVEAYVAAMSARGRVGRGPMLTMQAALREFATPTPPRPEEPQGLGAVVEDAEGDRWVLYTNPRNDAPWCNGCASVDYADIAAVRVLSDGVTP